MLFLWILPFVLLTGCATAPRYIPGQAILKGETPVFSPAPDSLRAQLEWTAFAGGRKSSVLSAFSAKPGLAYKLDLFGLPGMVAGSFLWQPEKWTLVVLDREEFVEGVGEHVAIGSLGIKEVFVHDMFSWLWGDFFPGDTSFQNGMSPALTPVGHNQFSYTAKGMVWRVSMAEKTGLIQDAVREDSAFRIRFSDYKVGKTGPQPQERPFPGKVELYRLGEKVLEIRVSGLEINPQWRRDPFFVKIPKGFKAVR